ncbi:MAG: hypothetical protein C0508_01190 [Cyanobacteria bacterium PR.023]|nr:hypothetical protein [Cyanobacteria bacterium PR.3.49]MBA4073622.1 hypothetical protein [Cyanobacteria bacterium PR.023]
MDGDPCELFIGLISPVGANLDLLTEILTEQLLEYGFKVIPIRLSALIDDIEGFNNLPKSFEDQRIAAYMDAGNKIRKKLSRNDALAAIALSEIRDKREQQTKDEDKPAPRTAYILRSMKRSEEVDFLRSVYGRSFWLAAAYSPRDKRVDDLAKQITNSRGGLDNQVNRAAAESLVSTDEQELGNAFGQNVRKTFSKADVFFNVGDEDKLKAAVERFLKTMLRFPYHTPVKDEYGMFHAQAAALRSASLGRQVGAVIASEEGDVISVGTNEVPKFGGGLYWEGDPIDHRDFTKRVESNDEIKHKLLADIFKNLVNAKWLNPAKNFSDIGALSDEIDEVLKDAQVMEIIEFYRAVHAEMAAIVDAARRGVSVVNATIYCTTFPCHECARHIIAAGIKRVVYIEPYPKSRAIQLHEDEISVDKLAKEEKKVRFEPFVGIAPRIFIEMFSMVPRKDKKGHILPWDGKKAKPKMSESPYSYIALEQSELARVKRAMAEAGLTPPVTPKEKGKINPTDLSSMVAESRGQEKPPVRLEKLVKSSKESKSFKQSKKDIPKRKRSKKR